MKVINILTHPIVLIASFLLIIISGRAFGGFYFFYLTVGLAGGHIHSLLGFAGAIGLVLSNQVKQNSIMLKYTIRILSALLLAGSIYAFFTNDRDHYNFGTFYQTVPQVMLALFAFVWIAFLLKQVVLFIRVAGKSNANTAGQIRHE